ETPDELFKLMAPSGAPVPFLRAIEHLADNGEGEDEAQSLEVDGIPGSAHWIAIEEEGEDVRIAHDGRQRSGWIHGPTLPSRASSRARLSRRSASRPRKNSSISTSSSGVAGPAYRTHAS